MSTVLIVDDDAAMLKICAKGLTKHGFKAFTAKSGEEALQMLEAIVVDVVLLDVAMLVMDGIETLGRIKERWPEAKVVAFSADEGYRETMMTGGCLDFICKPFVVRYLAARLRKALGES